MTTWIMTNEYVYGKPINPKLWTRELCSKFLEIASSATEFRDLNDKEFKDYMLRRYDIELMSPMKLLSAEAIEKTIGS